MSVFGCSFVMMIAMARSAVYHTDIAFYDHVGRPSDEDEMLDIVAPDEDEPAPAVDRGSVHDREAGPAVATAGDERPAANSANQPDQAKHDHQNQERERDPQNGAGVAVRQRVLNRLNQFHTPELPPL